MRPPAPPARRRRRCGRAVRSDGKCANLYAPARATRVETSTRLHGPAPAHRVELTTTLRDRHSPDPPGPPAAAAVARAGPGPASPRLQLPVMEANSTSNPRCLHDHSRLTIRALGQRLRSSCTLYSTRCLDATADMISISAAYPLKRLPPGL